MNAKHTPEPWMVGGLCGGTLYKTNGSGQKIARVPMPVNAARIVACVNACHGLSNEALGIDGPSFGKDYAAMQAKCDALRTQVAELAGALQFTLDELSDMTTAQFQLGADKPIRDKAIAALAKVAP